MVQKNKFPILYSFRRCPYAMRARLALYHAKISHEHREVDLKNKCKELLIISPKGTVPVLLLSDGKVLEQSLDIMVWALQSALSSKDQELIKENDDSFKIALDRYKYPNRYDEQKSIDYREECLKFINKVENMLTPYLSGNQPGLTDMALFPFIRQFVHVDEDWFKKAHYPKLKEWLLYFNSSKLFDHLMIKYEIWLPDDEPIIIKF